MFQLYKLQAKVWWSNPFSKTEYFTTTLLLIVIGSLIAFNMSAAPEAMLTGTNIAIISSITIMMVMNVAMYSFGFAFFEMKESVLLKRIGATKISKPKAIASFALWGMTTMLMMVGFIAMVVAICQISDSSGILYIPGSVWAEVNWFGVFTAVALTGLAYLPISLLFVSICKNSEIYNILTTFYLFIFAFLGMGMGSQGDNARIWITVIGYLSPMGWTNQLMQDSMNGLQVFNLSSMDNSWLSAGNFVFPVLYGALATGGCLKLFKWD